MQQKTSYRYFFRQEGLIKMTTPQGMDELFWGRDHEHINDWAERLTMVPEV
jgi:hypothetical protein